MASNLEFQKAYDALNQEQKMAVGAIEGPVMVVAGPGTGKTQILTLRIANILLQTDTEPENILALTFTEAAAHNMRRRLASLIGNLAYRVVINTFHGFCNNIIRSFPEDFPRIVGSRAITEIEAVAIIEEIINSLKLDLLKPYGDPFYYVRDIITSISELKREGIDSEKFTDLIEEEKTSFQNIADLYHDKGAHKGKMKGSYLKLERQIAKNEELALIYTQYQKKLAEQKGYDFSDMILEVLKALENNRTLLQLLQEEYQYVLVDEHQDTNNAQNKILELLMNYHQSPNLFVVGDEKQAIFRFQGASLENFQYLRRKYQDIKLINLIENYRSSQMILNSAECLLAGEKCLQKNAQREELKISLAEMTSPESEHYFVAHSILEKIQDGVEPSEIAILYRNNKQAFPIARALEKLGISYQIESDQDLFSQSDVAKFLIILEAISDYGNDILVTKLLHLNTFGIDPLDAYKLLKNASDRKKYSLYDLLADKKLLSEIDLSDKEAVLALGQKLKTWVVESREMSLLDFVEYIFRDSGLFEEIVASGNTLERFEAIRALFDQVRELVERKDGRATLFDFLAYLETIRKHKLFIKRNSFSSGENAVRLMTVHKSKGLEFAHVYITGAINGIFGGKVSRDKLPLIERVYSLEKNGKIDPNENSNDDERRLFYVALTRAKESVTISWSKENEEHKEMLPSEFIAEIKPELVEKVDTNKWQDKYNQDLDYQFRANEKEAEDKSKIEKEKVFVNDIFDKQGLSATALNNYLECPWKYFYQNLIRIPSVQNKHQCYGTAIHNALADFVNKLKKEPVGLPYLLSAFEHAINNVPLSVTDLEEAKAKGLKSLSAWFENCGDIFHINLRVQTEYRINGVELEEEDNKVRLTGVLDKIEWNDDETVAVTDYKTGKPKSRNELLGKTKSADGNYFRQLTFYKLLLNNFKDGLYVMQNGVIDFIEPDEKGKSHKESFEISDEEVSGLTETIFRVAEEIRNLDFWDKGCQEKDCEFCALRKLVQN